MRQQIDDFKAEFRKREHGLLDRCAQLVAEAGKEQIEYTRKLAELNMLFDHMEYDWRHRHLTITEDKLNLLGFKVINGKVQI